MRTASRSVTGTCSPLLTGGISSRLAGLVGSNLRTQRRAQGCTARTQPVVATPASWRDIRCSFRASAGVFQPGVLRVLLLSVKATARQPRHPSAVARASVTSSARKWSAIDQSARLQEAMSMTVAGY
ncbi:hypothetical protein CGL27_10330 [Streptomyces sp. 11-1-2]|nr:hypothetical protein CGL27_10330 [Streptomyces sp. 11-1-2]